MKSVLIIAFVTFSLPIFAQDFYTNGVLGVSVNKADGWTLLSEAERQSAILDTTVDHNGFNEYVLAHMSKQFVIITKPRRIPPQPTITALIAPLDSNMSTNPVETLEKMTASGAHVFYDYRIVEKPRSAEIGGRKAAYCKATYTLYLQDGDSVPVSFETWYLIRGNYYFLIGIVSRQPDDESTEKEITQIISSFKISEVNKS